MGNVVYGRFPDSNFPGWYFSRTRRFPEAVSRIDFSRMRRFAKIRFLNGNFDGS